MTPKSGSSDAPQARLATPRVLSRREAKPGAELRTRRELAEITDAGYQGRRCNGANTAQLHRNLGLFVAAHMLGNPLVTPGNVVVQFPPLLLCPL